MSRTVVAAAVSSVLFVGACASASTVDDDAAQPDEPATSTTTTSPPDTTTPSTEVTPGDTCQPVTADTEPRQETSIEFDLEAAGNSYPVRLFVPDLAADSSQAGKVTGRLPVVLNWHGLGSDGFQQALLTNYEALAETEGFIVAHPTGRVDAAGADSGDADRLQSGWELAQFEIPGRDDVAMAATLIDFLIDDYCADPDRIYSTGMSNGGFFTSRLICELADRIAAAVTVAGITHPDSCEPARAVPLLAFHGTADDIVPFDGGPSRLENAGGPPELTAFFDQVMPDELAEFASDFGCAPDPETTTVSDEVTVYDYRDCSDDVPVRFVEVLGGGHTWPGALIGVFTADALGPTTTDVSATNDGWNFMSRFSLDGRNG